MELDFTVANKKYTHVKNNQIECILIIEFFFVVDLEIFSLSAISSTQFVSLSWQPLLIVMNITFEFEAVYSIDSECSSDSLLDDGYTVYYPRTTNSSIEVFGLMSGTCYVFGVRAHTSPVLSTSPGQFTVISIATVSEGIFAIIV